MADELTNGIEAIERAQAKVAPSFTLGAEAFALAAEVDVRVIVAVQRGNIARALELALADPADVDRVLASDEPLTMDRFRDILDAWATAVGGDDLGNSAAS